MKTQIKEFWRRSHAALVALAPSLKLGVKEFWRRSHAALIFLPLLIALTFGAYIVLRALDSRIGLEGFGDVFGYFINGIRAVMVVAAAFWVKRIAWFDLHRPTELALFEKSRDGDRNAERIVWRDRVEWAFLLVFFGWLFTR